MLEIRYIFTAVVALFFGAAMADAVTPNEADQSGFVLDVLRGNTPESGVVDVRDLARAERGAAPVHESLAAQDSGDAVASPAPVNVFRARPKVELVEIKTAEKSVFAMTQSEAEAYLRAQPPKDISQLNVPLRVAIQAIADASGMNYMTPRAGEFVEPVTLRVFANAFDALTMLCDMYGVGMELHDGIWRFFTVNHNEMVVRTYKLRFNNRSDISSTPHQLGGNLSSGDSGSSSSGSGGGFNIDGSRIVAEISELLAVPVGTPSLNVGHGGKTGSFEPLDEPTAASDLRRNGAAPSPQVMFISDTNSLLLSATRTQHEMVRTYLDMIDKPPRLVKIEANFVETSRNPSSEMGINWNSVSGATIGLAEKVKEDGNIVGDINVGQSTILTVSEMAVQLNFIRSDSESAVVQDPKVVTLNNKEVTLRYVTQQPIKSAESTVSTGAAAESGSSIDYIEIGTVMNIFPQIVDETQYGKGEAVNLNLSIVVSSQSGTQVIDGNSFPVISSRTYTYSVTVPSGYTLAIGGLREMSEFDGTSSVPVLGGLPVLGHLFRNKSNDRRSTNLIAFITPTILTAESGEFAVSQHGAMPTLENMMAQLEKTTDPTIKERLREQIREWFRRDAQRTDAGLNPSAHILN